MAESGRAPHTEARSLWRRLFPPRLPLVLQATATECGAACLARILAYYGRPTSVADCRERLGVSRDGVRPRMFVEAAAELGMRAKAFSTNPENLGQLPLPAIAHWRFNHFVVIERCSPKGVDLFDPMVGRRHVSAQEFSEGFTGVVLTFELGPQFVRGGSLPSPWGSFLRPLLRIPAVKSLAFQVLAASLLLQVLGLAVPLLTKVLVDHVLPLRGASLMAVLGVGMVAVAVSQAVTGYLRNVLLVSLKGRFDEQLVLGMLGHLLKLPFRFFMQRTSGDLLARLSSTGMIREVLANQTLTTVLDGALMVTYLAILFAQAPLFGALALGLGLLQLLLVLATARRMRELMQRGLTTEAEFQSFTVQAFKGMAVVKASAAEDMTLRFWSSLFHRQLDNSLERGHLTAFINAALGTLRTFAPLALLWVGALQVLDGKMGLGTMLALNAVAVAVLTPLAQLVTTWQQLHLTGAHLARLLDVLEAEPEPQPVEARPAPRLRGHIHLENVGYRYGRGSAPVLQGLSLTIEPGQKVAVVGRSGSGKSTLGSLVLGLLDPTEGRILFDGMPLKELDVRQVRAQFGVVMQEPLLFSGSLRENVSLNAPGLSLAQIEEAVRLAALEEEVLRMPMRYETWVGEGGAGLSGGQRQRLALARALATRPSLLLLDEATSHLDTATEAQVDAHLSRLSCTRIIIAHRLSTVRNADLILVLDQGRVVEQGTHDTLMEKNGLYAALARGQAADVAPIPPREARGEKDMASGPEREARA
ncbi:peptidase domain-containing ABC transporter [Hyalangium versicolor]|uniref:peptidase domain-containing ABC transporter n=1 Tax=Hyalangium versicolor TaxID=2861190 RepID=UPI001CCED6C3|nr:peptidase domain-containing ABC transporter [Hyalangium versicolor]